MADIFNTSKRSEIMSKVRSKGNRSTELRLIKAFDTLGITGWRRNYDVKGHPDFVFLSSKTAVFVDGCFWHGHNCRNTTPKDNAEFWEKKIRNNKLHDKEVTDRFEKRGWTVVRIWECELSKKKQDVLYEKLTPLLKNDLQETS